MADPNLSSIPANGDEDADKKIASSSLSLSFPETTPTTQQHARPVVLRSIPELLWQRETATITRSSYHYEKVVPHRKQFFGDLAPSTEQLASNMAWNSSRMQNMILAVGPGTPASLLMTDRDFGTASALGSDNDDENDEDDDDDDDDDEYVDEDHDDDDRDHDLDENEDDNDDDDDEQGLLEAEDEHDCPRESLAHFEDSDNDNDEEENEHGEEEELPRPRLHRIAVSEPNHDETMQNIRHSTQHQHQLLPWMRGRNERYAPVPSMRHGGCINTAAWLTSSWRLSTVSHPGIYGMASSSFSSNDDETMAAISSIQPVASHECPTQLLTSGDDRVVKFWDVSSAMGSANPLHGGTATVCPFSAPTPRWSTDVAQKRWKSYYMQRMTTASSTSSTTVGASSPSMQISGSVIPLLTLATGHQSNVFHVTPLDWHMGKVASCGADGYLRLSDVVTETNSIIVGPDDRGNGDGTAALMGYFNLHPNMCFSHVFLNANAGLLCTERGLKRFDIRLPPQEQPTQNLLGATSGSSGQRLGAAQSSTCCKTCAVYSYSSLDGDSNDEESAYVFAGGASPTVSLFDLRMTGGDDSSSRVIERYRPKGLDRDSLVSVSGLDISKDRRELLVSYENDQIYTFPIFPNASSPAGPALEEIRDPTDDDDGDNQDGIVSELCSYGAHLNRFTFLKNAKYAGPRDDYICTGSDSGRAWIYERSTGSVVSLLNADRSTCNGVVPHPTLPIFITYGIESTAKLWRATLPVDSNVDDSAAGRVNCFHQRPYDMSPTARNWQAVQEFLGLAVNMTSDDQPLSIFPDQIPHSKEMVHRGRLGRAFPLSPDPGVTQIGNDLRHLPHLLRQNAFACFRGSADDLDNEPVRSGLNRLKRRLCSIRLRHQANANGVLWNRGVPWMFEPKRDISALSKRSLQLETSSLPASTLIPYGDTVDLVPDNPSDWIPYDPQMTNAPLPCGTPFNVEDYEDVYERYRNPRGCVDTSCNRSGITVWKCPPSLASTPVLRVDGSKPDKGIADRENRISDNAHSSSVDVSKPEEGISDRENGFSDNAHSSSVDGTKQGQDGSAKGQEALNILCETVTLLKEGGNAALQAGNVHLAATRYDKVLQYCAIAFMDYPSINLTFRGAGVLQRRSWTPILKVLITTRLNLSMCLLRPEIAKPQRAVDQTQLALKELKRFATRRAATGGNGEADQLPADGSRSAHMEALELQAKAYFRLGSAQYDLSDYAASCRSFEHSAKITKAISKTAQPDKLTMRRLAEAKRENARQSKRQKKMFKFMFSGQDPDEAAASNTEAATASTTNEDNQVPPSGDHGQEEAGKSSNEEMTRTSEMPRGNEVTNSSETAGNETAHSDANRT